MKRRELLLMAAGSLGAQTRVEADYQARVFNEFATAYNRVAERVMHGEWPLRELKAVQRRWRELQALPGWPKEKC